MADSSAAGSTEQETALLDAKSKKALFEAKIAEQSKKADPAGETEEEKKKREFAKKKNLFQVMEGSAKPIKDKPEMRFRSKTMERQFNGVDVNERRDPFDDAKPVAESPHGPADEALKEVSVKKRASLFGGGSVPPPPPKH